MSNIHEFEDLLRSAVASNQETPPEEPAETSEEVLEALSEPAAESGEIVEVEAPDRPRDESGRFVPSFKDPAIKSYVDKFGGDLSAALRSAVEAQSLIGRQGSELGELRKEVEEMREVVNRPTPFDEDSFRSMIEEDPQQAVYAAAKRGDEYAFDSALAAWYEVDPRSASRFERELEFQRFRTEMQEAIRPIAEPVREQTMRHLAAQAKVDLERQYSDFGEVLSSVTEDEVAGLDTQSMRELSAQNPKAALELVYRWVKAGRSTREHEDAERAREEAREAKKDSYVASSSSRPATETKDNLEKFKEFMLSPEPTSVIQGLRKE